MLSSVLTSKYHIYISPVAINNLCFSIRLRQARNTTQLTTSTRTRRQNKTTAKPAWPLLCGDFRVVNCVQKSPQSTMMPTDITVNQTCMFRIEQLWSTMTCGVTDQARVNPETAWKKLTNWEDTSAGCRGQTQFIGKQEPSCRCRSSRGVKLTTPQPGTETRNAWE